MADIVFLPAYAEVLAQVVVAAERQGAVDVAVRPDVDPAVVAAQVRRFAAERGVALRCAPDGDRVAVRARGGRGRSVRAS